MKRARKKRNRKVIDYWQSYSDMLAALLLVFILIMFAAIQKMESQQDALAYQQQTIEKQRITIQSLGGDSGSETQKLQEISLIIPARSAKSSFIIIFRRLCA